MFVDDATTVSKGQPNFLRLARENEVDPELEA